ncbi:CDP-diacylglycerol--serine O-phosphatidyltransferase [Novosphingobium hassiacum]|uniref:CDP-diacylglycerol--serine O-phosphatidyltransferase n=1 Tax=Novosphingobium hassiacum TaxID=173676 RepID=A0A7W5ZS20_9SPHN|nr:phosphatidylcholine/phosphatidylserine synthase [Novosphingobium hassiacum]MBB3858968.1 CDP-diacylglycerol--serine O-phosphatidyltransferase [Novosphingobium hassiacum]
MTFAHEPETPRGRLPGGLTLRAMTPNAITVAALCSGLTGIRFAVTAASGTDPLVVAEDWRKAVIAVIIAGILDGLDGRIARLLKAQSRFGAELDSLADNVSFGVAPALILFLWSLQEAPRVGWFAALAVAIACALRLARFNARIDNDVQPHKSAGFLTGIPAPVGAGLAFLPLYLWIATDNPLFRLPVVVGPWLVLIAFLMISNIATLSWTSLRPRRSVRLELMGLVGLVIAALLTEPWLTLVGICVVYILLLPLGVLRYARVKRQRANARPVQLPSE